MACFKIVSVGQTQARPICAMKSHQKAVNLGVMTGRKHRGAFRGAGKFCFLIRGRLHRCVQLVKTHHL